MNTINNFVDRIFVINIGTRKDKWKKMVEQFDRLGITNYERFDAYVPTNEDINSDPNKFLLYQVLYFPGAIGCKYSHLQVISEAKKRDYGRILILEDDALFCEDFNNIFSSLVGALNIIDWDMLYLGANHENIGEFISTNIRRCFTGYTTSSYILNSRMYDQILEEAPRKKLEIDNYYVQCIQNKGKTYAITPNLVTQFESISDISGKHAKYDFKNC